MRFVVLTLLWIVAVSALGHALQTHYVSNSSSVIEPIGEFVENYGSTRVRRAGSIVWEIVPDLGEELSNGDTIATSSHGGARVSLRDESEIAIADNSIILLKRENNGASGLNGPLSITLHAGNATVEPRKETSSIVSKALRGRSPFKSRDQLVAAPPTLIAPKRVEQERHAAKLLDGVSGMQVAVVGSAGQADDDGLAGLEAPVVSASQGDANLSQLDVILDAMATEVPLRRLMRKEPVALASPEGTAMMGAPGALSESSPADLDVNAESDMAQKRRLSAIRREKQRQPKIAMIEDIPLFKARPLPEVLPSPVPPSQKIKRLLKGPDSQKLWVKNFLNVADANVLLTYGPPSLERSSLPKDWRPFFEVTAGGKSVELTSRRPFKKESLPLKVAKLARAFDSVDALRVSIRTGFREGEFSHLDSDSYQFSIRSLKALNGGFVTVASNQMSEGGQQNDNLMIGVSDNRPFRFALHCSRGELMGSLLQSVSLSEKIKVERADGLPDGGIHFYYGRERTCVLEANPVEASLVRHLANRMGANLVTTGPVTNSQALPAAAGDKMLVLNSLLDKHGKVWLVTRDKLIPLDQDEIEENPEFFRSILGSIHQVVFDPKSVLLIR